MSGSFRDLTIVSWFAKHLSRVGRLVAIASGAVHRTPMDTDSLLDPELATLVSGFMLDDLDDTMVSAFRDVPPAPPLESETVESIDHTVDGDPAIIVRVHRAR